MLRRFSNFLTVEPVFSFNNYYFIWELIEDLDGITLSGVFT
jgi:hypothetical protein